ncbi:MAG TPA: cupin domain-containing protein [Ktedonobacteraceae bacterium]|nr:cupin domain-containing protein [Ktedonobacteraceae bacterium]
MSALVILPGEGKALQIGGGGLGVVFKLFGADTGGQFAVVEHPLAPGALGGPSHIHHHEDEASYVLEGEVMVQIGDQLIQAPMGTWLFKPRGIPHTFWNSGAAPARILEIISPAGFEKYFEELAELVKPGIPPDIPALIALGQKYGVDLDISSVPELSKKYQVSLG